MNGLEKLIERGRSRYGHAAAPLLHALCAEMYEKRPYRDLRILYNLPLFRTNLLSIESLIASGAELTLTKARFVESDPEVVEWIRQAQLPFVESHEDIRGEFDVFLDCCAELGSRLTPRIGAVEITQTGAQRYRKLARPFPVISVDDSSVKRLEDSLGSADGFVRALAVLNVGSLVGQQALLFGYGKVGVGLSNRLRRERAIVTVVDRDPRAVERARANGLAAWHLDDTERLIEAIREADLVVTATGTPGFLSARFAPSLFTGKRLANIGAEDEFGPAFAETDVLFAKRPINFVLPEPTTVQYLDPAFYAHNVSVGLLQAGEFAAGVHALPGELDRQILDRWFAAHGESLAEFELTYGDHRDVFQ